MRASLYLCDYCAIIAKGPHENSCRKHVLKCVFFSKLICGSFDDGAAAYVQQFIINIPSIVVIRCVLYLYNINLIRKH